MEKVSPSSHQDMLGCLALISRSERRKRGRGQTAAVVISKQRQALPEKVGIVIENNNK